MRLPRRAFLKAAAGASAACLLGPRGLARAAQRLAITPGLVEPRPSPFYEPLADGAVRCTLCPNACEPAPGERGACDVRRNDGGRLMTLVYGNPCAVHLDPIEKKPFFHVLPGTTSLSLATAGCNFACEFCQNWEISQKPPEETVNVALPPQAAVELAAQRGAASVASTYVEPSIFMEYMLDLGRQCRQAGLLKVMHSNGYLNRGPLGQLMRVLDAACIDLKSIRPEYYREVCAGRLAPVLDTLRALKAAGVWVEVVNLVIPTLNDSEADLLGLIRFVRDDLGAEVPVHFTRFHPQYKLTHLPPTPVATLERALELARQEGLEFAYVGNVPGHPGGDTRCPGCGKVLLERWGNRLEANHLRDGACPACGRAIAGLWRRKNAT